MRLAHRGENESGAAFRDFNKLLTNLRANRATWQK
jgi:hypothetical protein